MELQFCANGDDIGGSPCAIADATEVRAWAEDGTLLGAVTAYKDGWRVTGSDVVPDWTDDGRIADSWEELLDESGIIWEGREEFIAELTISYARTMLWANTREYREGCDGKPCDGNAPGECGGHEVYPDDFRTGNGNWPLLAFSPESRRMIKADCEAFVSLANRDLIGLDAGQCGHDLALTRNHHGAGFWDRGYGDLGDRLAEVAHSFGESNAWFQEDGDGFVHLDDEG